MKNILSLRTQRGLRVTRLNLSRNLTTQSVNKIPKPGLSYSQCPKSNFVALKCTLQPIQNRHFSRSAIRNGQIKPFLLADIGEGITEVEIVKWIVEPNATVEEFDNLVEVQSDKSSVEISSPYNGKVVKLHYDVGQVAKVGQPLCDIEIEDSEETQEDVAEEPTSTESSVDKETLAKEEETTKQAEYKFVSKEEQQPDHSSEYVLATPSTRRIAKEHNIKLENIKGSGKDGRVTKTDVLEYVKSLESTSSATETTPTTPATTTSAPSAPPPPPQVQPQGGKFPMSANRRAMARAMGASLNIPHFGYSEEIDVTNLEKTRLQINEAIPLRFRKTLPPGVDESTIMNRVDEDSRFDKITLLPLMVKAMARSMDEHPLFKCLANNEHELIQQPSTDISIALSPPSGGLYTPVITNADKSSPLEIAAQINKLQSIARASAPPKFPPHLLKPGTITLSNVGVVGGTYTHPVVPPTGQLAIGAIGQTRVLPRYAPTSNQKALWNQALNDNDGSTSAHLLQPRLISFVTFTGDHRYVEGVELAHLVDSWKKRLQQPALLISEGV